MQGETPNKHARWGEYGWVQATESMVLHFALHHCTYLGMSYELAKPVKVEQSSHSLERDRG